MFEHLLLLPFWILIIRSFDYFFILLGLHFMLYWFPRVLIMPFIRYYYPNVLMYTNKPNVKNISITIDDVVNDLESFKEILSIFDKYNVRCTFFIISDFINDNNRSLLVKAIQDGHQLGNHGKTNSMHFLKSSSILENEIVACDNIIKELYEEADIQFPHTPLYRPGCGLFTQNMINIAKKYNYTVTLGSIYPNDPLIRFWYINYIYIRLKLLISHDYNNVIILHDRKWTAKLLDNLIPYLQSNDYQIETIEDILY